MDAGIIAAIVSVGIAIFLFGVFVGLCLAQHIWHKCLDKVAKEFEEKYDE